MKSRQGTAPEDVMRRVTIEIIGRAIRLGRKNARTIRISKTSGGKGVDVTTLDPATEAGRAQLEDFLSPVKRQYTVSGLGAAQEAGAVNWRRLNLPLGKRVLRLLQVAVSIFMRGGPAKNRLYRWMGVHVGEGAEIMQMAWLDHFRPELIFIGDNTLIGAFSQLTVHSYEGAGRFRYGLIEIGADCKLGAGVGIGPIKIGDGVRTLPGTTVSPYYARIPSGAVVGGEKPPLVMGSPAPPGEARSGEAVDEIGAGDVP
jgi:acetyltransferase-like isoleucine patch superfamily enzyme